jgi:hypothetical protein
VQERVFVPRHSQSGATYLSEGLVFALEQSRSLAESFDPVSFDSSGCATSRMIVQALVPTRRCEV